MEFHLTNSLDNLTFNYGNILEDSKGYIQLIESKNLDNFSDEQKFTIYDNLLHLRNRFYDQKEWDKLQERSDIDKGIIYYSEIFKYYLLFKNNIDTKEHYEFEKLYKNVLNCFIEHKNKKELNSFLNDKLINIENSIVNTLSKTNVLIDQVSRSDKKLNLYSAIALTLCENNFDKQDSSRRKCKEFAEKSEILIPSLHTHKANVIGQYLYDSTMHDKTEYKTNSLFSLKKQQFKKIKDYLKNHYGEFDKIKNKIFLERLRSHEYWQ